MNLQVGDRVQIGNGLKWSGETGTVIKVCQGSVGIEFDGYSPRRHSCDGLTQRGYGWWYFFHEKDFIFPQETRLPPLDDLI